MLQYLLQCLLQCVFAAHAAKNEKLVTVAVLTALFPVFFFPQPTTGVDGSHAGHAQVRE